jgi:hypothetical protein
MFRWLWVLGLVGTVCTDGCAWILVLVRYSVDRRLGSWSGKVHYVPAAVGSWMERYSKICTAAAGSYNRQVGSQPCRLMSQE